LDTVNTPSFWKYNIDKSLPKIVLLAILSTPPLFQGEKHVATNRMAKGHPINQSSFPGIEIARADRLAA
jgi:hypothetical protein